ncbi:MAG: ABC transporter ATP-binding protein [Phototrophicales bacterium]|nr:MAG: ABC transporter ATP-binding protein [Phototrophicales bacterium]
MPLVNVRHVSKTYIEAERKNRVLDRVDVDFYKGEFVVLLGPSGSGKSTLLNLVSGVDQPDEGSIVIDDVEITALNERNRTLFRRDHIGIVFQSFNLIPTLTVAENIALPYELQGKSRRVARQRALDLLERVGIAGRGDSFPDRLSGGQQQRVAVARAIVHEPKLVLADEPTGNLDRHTSDDILNLLLEMTRGAGKTLIMATHSMEIIPLADRIFRIHEGKLIEDTERLKRAASLRAELEQPSKTVYTPHPN